jgi:hypothetical protein
MVAKSTWHRAASANVHNKIVRRSQLLFCVVNTSGTQWSRLGDLVSAVHRAFPIDIRMLPKTASASSSPLVGSTDHCKRQRAK